jgi:hypothetical protein
VVCRGGVGANSRVLDAAQPPPQKPHTGKPSPSVAAQVRAGGRRETAGSSIKKSGSSVRPAMVGAFTRSRKQWSKWRWLQSKALRGNFNLTAGAVNERPRPAQGRPPQPGPEGSQKNPRGSAPKIFACGALCHRADLAKQPRFFARLPKITSAPQANAPQASKIGRAARFWGFLGTARPKSHCSAPQSAASARR